jgi:5-methylcytosine-specific restriction protein A
MARPAKVCRKPDCFRFRPCPVPGHEPKAWEGSNRRSRLPSNWEQLRRFILERDPVCRICGEALSTVCDHRVPGDDHSPENLQGICSDCDRRKSSREGHEAKRRAARRR